MAWDFSANSFRTWDERGGYPLPDWVIEESGKWVIEKQMANGNQQLAKAKMIPIGMFRLVL
jgi:hypothetical protein